MTTHAPQAMASTPLYQQQPQPAPAARRLLVCQSFARPEVEALRSALAQFAEPLQVLTLSSAAGEPRVGHSVERFDQPQALRERLQALLAEAPVGTRVYLCGDEVFLWDGRQLAEEAGLLDEEIELFRTGARRRLYCVHCATFQDIADEAFAECASCGLHLLVRTHFSRRLGAYMGVCSDPNLPRAEVRP